MAVEKTISCGLIALFIFYTTVPKTSTPQFWHTHNKLGVVIPYILWSGDTTIFHVKQLKKLDIITAASPILDRIDGFQTR